MINKVSRPLRPIVSRQRRLSGVSVPEPRQDGLGGDDLFIYLFYSGRSSSAGEVYLFIYVIYLFFFQRQVKRSDPMLLSSVWHLSSCLNASLPFRVTSALPLRAERWE